MDERSMQVGSRSAAVAMLLSAAVVAAAAWAIAPDRAAWMPVCPFHSLTGLHCPGCGTLRALHQLVHGNLSAALALNPLTVILTPVLLYSLAREVSARVGVRTPVRSSVVSVAGPWVLVAVIVVFWVARNVAVYPLTLLAPH